MEAPYYLLSYGYRYFNQILKLLLILATYRASQVEENMDKQEYKFAVILAVFAITSSYLIQQSAVIGIVYQPEVEEERSTNENYC
jgi:hypothetical protein